MDPELGKARRFMQEKILHFLAQRQTQATTEVPHRRILDLVKRLEEGLFMTAATQDEYLNLETLESRLHVIIKGHQMSNNNPQSSQYSNSTVTSTDNSTVTASTGNNVSAGNSALNGFTMTSLTFPSL